jgi:predicted negative regulator of RcsB-dependent stress response
MKRLIIIVLLALAAWQGYGQYQSHRAAKAAPQPLADVPQPMASPAKQPDAEPTAQYKCDGRTHCSQMTSCAEATYFLKNCPGVKMDGNNDGIPCEKQWCKP